ncbi:hypothetical protein QMK61_12115 [Fulvimonas sp. R45]|uniref:DUF6624 domain-containing protein n=1 Tax=Fulvimonas sp. R45 TaxID=3045937 RepID=UPI00265E2540|nr:DUF6624 domain-containing protein [Fulvimonas sp. R45]MDO1529576.1 hypothetical protein [Fulvimonas sp. R45]
MYSWKRIFAFGSMSLFAMGATVALHAATPAQGRLNELLASSRTKATPSSSDLSTFKGLVLQSGWPTEKLVGPDGMKEAARLLLAEQADSAFQEAALGMLMQRVGIDVSALGFAELNDRIEQSHGRPQQFGTIFVSQSGQYALPPQISAQAADNMRDSIGLGPVEMELQTLNDLAAVGVQSPRAAGTSRLYQPRVDPTNPRLRARLAAMATQDQADRNAVYKAGPVVVGQTAGKEVQKMLADDKDHTAAIKAIIESGGFPSGREVGRDGVENAFLLIQHSADKGFMKASVSQVRLAMLRGDLPRSEYAKFVDRILMLDGKNQIYGSQFHVVDHKMVPYPIEDPANVESRRRAMYMLPLKVKQAELSAAMGG